MRRLILALWILLFSLMASAAIAASTVAVQVTSSAWVDLGAGPLLVQSFGDPVRVAISDSSPGASAPGFSLTVGITPQTFSTASHVWAKSSGTSSVVTAPLAVPLTVTTKRAPTVTDDSTKGYAVGNLWNSSQGLFVAQDVTAGKASWTLSLVGNVLPCDAVTGALVCYGTKLMRTGYAGKAYNVVRASDSTNQDIGFVNGDLDTKARDAFCQGTTCSIATVYDQSGNGNNCAQATGANQPVVNPQNDVNGVSSIVFDSVVNSGSTTTVFCTFTYTGTSSRTLSMFMTGQLADAWVNSGIIRLGIDGNDVQPQLRNTGSPGITHLSVAQFSGEGSLMPLTSPTVLGFVFGNTVASIYENNWSNSITGTGIPSNTLSTGQLSFANSPGFNGRYDLTSFVLYGSILSAGSIATLQQSMTKQFNIYPQVNDFILADGDSVAYGFGSTNLLGYHRQAIMTGTISRPVIEDLTAKYGDTLASMNTNFTGKVAASWLSTFTNYVVTVKAGNNDISANSDTGAQAYARLVTYVASAHALGSNVRVVCGTLLPGSYTGPQQTQIDAFNALLRSNTAGCDAISDFQANPVMGPTAAASNTLLYPDGLHPSTLGNAILAPIYGAAVSSVLH